jgi:hypothetical protein
MPNCLSAASRLRTRRANPIWGYGVELVDPDGYLVRLWDEVSMREK